MNKLFDDPPPQIAISLHQPWATLFCLGEKLNETRSWPFPAQYKGRTILIHAAKKWDSELTGICRQPAFRDAFLRHLDIMGEGANPQPEIDYKRISIEGNIMGRDTAIRLPFGCIIGSVRLLESIDAPQALYPGTPPARVVQENELGDFSVGRYAWIGVEHKLLDRFIPVRGAQGFFKVDLTEVSSRR